MKLEIKKKIQNYKVVIENYFFMTTLQVLNSFFYILIYPFLIKTLGVDGYGFYVFTFSIITYFIAFINFGFDFPGVKAIAQYRDDSEVKSQVFSCIFMAKIYLWGIAFLVLLILLVFIDSFSKNLLLISVCFLQTIGCVLFPTYFFQAIQKMRWVTFINVVFKVVSLPFIFIFITSPTDVWKYALIVSLSTLGGSLVAFYLVIKVEKIPLIWYPFDMLRKYYRDALPFFWSTSTSIVKQQSANVIVGIFFGMGEVAIYDLANKIIQLPQLLTTSINGALFPKIIHELNSSKIKKIIRYETGIGIIIILGVILVGKWIILLLGGEQMSASYPIAVLLSGTVLTWLVVGCYISFIFVPLHKYYLVTKNQIVAFVSFFSCCVIGLLCFDNIWVIALAFVLSGICEVVYCYGVVRKYGLLSMDILKVCK